MAVRFSASGHTYTRTLSLSTQTALTVCGWFKISTDRNDYSSLFFIDNGTSDNWGMQTGADGTTMATVFDASTQEGIGAMTVGTWYFICLATSGTTGNIYYRTAAQSTLTTVAVTSVTASVSATTLRIGESPWGNEFLNGCVADVKGWNVQLTAAEALNESHQYVPHRTANELFFYPFLKAETADYSGNGRTLSGGTGATTEDGPPIPWAGTRPKLILPASTDGSVTLDGTGTTAAAATGSMAVDRPLTSTASAASAATGQLSVTRPLDGTSAAANGSTGALGATRAITGTTAASASATGELVRGAGLAGTAAAAAAGLTGNADIARGFSGHADAASGGTGALAADRPLTGTSPAASSATGDMTTQGQVDLAGTGSAASSATGLLTVARPFTGVSTSAADLDGALAVTRPLTAVLAAASGLSGDLTTGSGTFLCQDLGGTVLVESYGGAVTVESYGGTATVESYGGTVIVESYGGTATNCGR